MEKLRGLVHFRNPDGLDLDLFLHQTRSILPFQTNDLGANCLFCRVDFVELIPTFRVKLLQGLAQKLPTKVRINFGGGDGLVSQ